MKFFKYVAMYLLAQAIVIGVFILGMRIFPQVAPKKITLVMLIIFFLPWVVYGRRPDRKRGETEKKGKSDVDA